MNLSGLSLRETVKKYKLASSDCLLVYDEYAIPFGKMRAKPEGSSGGHNGVASAIEALSTREIPRLRLGIGTNAKPDDLANFVLEEFDLDELRALPALVETASAAIDSFFTESFHNLMNRFNK
jgi:PTH1 family peptidyl-tRNA hydrolase